MSIDFKLQDFASPYPIFKLRRFFEKSQYFPKEVREKYLVKRLKSIIRHAYRNVPYYRELFKKENIKPTDITRLSDLHALPRLKKVNLQNNFTFLTAENARQYKPNIERTSGTTGAPCRFLSDKSSRALEFVFYWRHWSWAGYRLGQRFVELSSHYFAKSPERMETLSTVDRLTGRILLNALKISPDNMGSLLKTIRKYRPKYLKGVASALYFFAFWVQQKNVDDVAFRAVFSTGEMLTERYRALIEQVFHCKVLDTYGHMERTVAITQCAEGGYHINSDYGLMELVDTQPLGEGLNIGTVVGTSLHNLAMPLIRYEVGDFVEFYDNPPKCTCGRKLPLIKAIHGRHEDVIITPDERIITSIYITLNLVKGFDFGQFLQEKTNCLQVSLIKSRDFKAADEDAFLQVLRNFVGYDMDIKLSYIKPHQILKDASGKTPIVISKLKPEQW